MELKIVFPRSPSPLQLPQVPLAEKEEEHKEQEGGGRGRQRGKWDSPGRREAEASVGPEGEDGSQPIPLWKILKLKKKPSNLMRKNKRS